MLFTTDHCLFAIITHISCTNSWSPLTIEMKCHSKGEPSATSPDKSFDNRKNWVVLEKWWCRPGAFSYYWLPSAAQKTKKNMTQCKELCAVHQPNKMIWEFVETCRYMRFLVRRPSKSPVKKLWYCCFVFHLLKLSWSINCFLELTSRFETIEYYFVCSVISS